MKKISKIFFALIIVLQSVTISVVPSVGIDAYYPSPSLDGEESKTVTYLYDGVTRTDYVLANTSKYKKQVFTTVEFDPSQDDLYFDVCGGGSYLSSLSKTSNTVAKFNAREPDKKVLVATNGDFWGTNNYDVRVEGNESNYVSNPSLGYTDENGNTYPANVTKAYAIPFAFNMHDGEIVSSMRMAQEKPDFGLGHYSFGITADGEALLGQIITTTVINNKTKGITAKADGINRLPENNALVLYTDKGYAKTYCLSDAYEFAFDCTYDYCVKDGVTISATLTEISNPGETRLSMKANRLILTARGNKIPEVTAFEVGDAFTFSVTIEDLFGNTEKWRTVTNCVGGRMPAIINGIPTGITDTNTTYNPSTLLGIKENGNVVIITSYGRQYSAAHGYYSYGLKVCDYVKLAKDLDIVTLLLCDGGGSATMVCETDTGGYELTGRPCDSGYTERTVINSVLISVGPPKSNPGTDDISLNSENYSDIIRDSRSIKCTAESDYNIKLLATGFRNPSFLFDLFGGTYADSNRYMVVEGTPTMSDGGEFTLGIYPSAGRNLNPSSSQKIDLTFKCDGTWQRQLVDLSDHNSWKGRMNYIRMDLFGDTGVGIMGEGFKMKRIRFFNTLSAANEFMQYRGENIRGDADGNGNLNLSDVSLVLKCIAKWNVAVEAEADYNDDGKLTLFDAALILRKIVE
ncbi:MAG: hypothetical protein E7578_00530 [Ruminococcaceae bacterium]|nr:hypothetical protein [Oscillospiraceae bacterium]